MTLPSLPFVNSRLWQYASEFGIVAPRLAGLQDFDVQIDFLEKLYRMEPRSLAVQLSEDDLLLFRWLTVDDITEGRGDVLSALNFRWNSLCRGTEECSATGDSFDPQLVELAQELYRLRNYYSLTAILQGVRSSGRSLAMLQKFDYLINSEQSYLQYRQSISSGPALHFLFPFLQTRFEKAAVVAASRVVSSIKKYTLYTLENEFRSPPRHRAGLLSFLRSSR
ncbi:RasGEF domain-containing protein [Aspergillus alliaceus]|uniref:RasGEF domain-containing protein n=1 Tax=Petromyces alliaceus TaxID=209559 RepID=UPI0012A71C98|nr:uncharacterized protein BDW43DRAFT_267245 [Aspergillus alliaceus]KAB8236596.1 hypothetical protein BDW43DRAFT_267245 [Aspergillus alliaceus]